MGGHKHKNLINSGNCQAGCKIFCLYCKIFLFLLHRFLNNSPDHNAVRQGSNCSILARGDIWPNIPVLVSSHNTEQHINAPNSTLVGEADSTRPITTYTHCGNQRGQPSSTTETPECICSQNAHHSHINLPTLSPFSISCLTVKLARLISTSPLSSD